MHSQSRFLIRVLAFIGLLPRNEESTKWRLIRILAWHLPATILYTALMWVDAALSKDFSYTVVVMHVALTESALCMKIYNIWCYGPKAMAVLNKWQHSPMYALHTQEELEMWTKSQRQFGIVQFWYIVGSLLSVFGTFSTVLFKSDTVLPIPFWVPYDWHKPTNYWITLGYELWAMPLSATANVTLDMFFCYLIYHTSLTYRLLGMRLALISGQDDKVKKQLTQNIQLHQIVNEDANECGKIVENPALTHIVMNSFVICFSIFTLIQVH